MSEIGQNDGLTPSAASLGDHRTCGGVTALTTAGKRVPFLVTATGALVTSDTGGTSVSRVSSTALEASRVIKNASGTLWDLTIDNSKTSEQWIQLHNTTSVPADTAVPVWIIRVAASTSVMVSFQEGMPFATGISVCNSSTAATKTVGSSDCFFSANYT